MTTIDTSLATHENLCRAAIFTNIETIECGTIPFPQLESSTDAILKIIVCGICGSDLHPYHGRESCAYGTAFGHECVGEIIQLGNDVSSNFHIGDLVSVPFSIACGQCFYCQQNLSARCTASQLLGWKDNEGHGLHGAQVCHHTIYLKIYFNRANIFVFHMHQEVYTNSQQS